jgi:outer membrane protein assembly factor BamB
MASEHEYGRRAVLQLAGAGAVASGLTRPVAGGTPSDETTSHEAGWRLPGASPTNTFYEPETEGPTTDLSVRWSVDVGITTSRSEAVVDDERVFAAGARLVATSLDGDLLWEREQEPKWAGPALGDERLYAYDAIDLHALAPETGETLWREPIDAQEAQFVPAGDAVFAVGYRHPDVEKPSEVVALEAATGDRQWTREFEAHRYLAVDDDTVYTVGDGGVRATDRDTGENRWTYEGDERWHEPSVADGSVYCMDEASVVAIDAGTGEQSWSTRIQASERNLVVTGDAIYCTTDDRTLAVLDPATGEIRREHDHGAGVRTGAGDVLYGRGLHQSMRAVDPENGHPLGRVTLDGTPVYSIAVTGDGIYFVTDGGTLHGVEGACGDGESDDGDEDGESDDGGDDSGEEGDDTSNGSDDGTDAEGTDDGSPGPGIVGTLAGLGATAGWLARTTKPDDGP